VWCPPLHIAQACSVSKLTSLLPTVKFTNELVSTYTSNDDLIETIMASCYIPVYYSNPPGDGTKFDGGFTANQPVVPSLAADTITVDPCDNERMISNRRTTRYPAYAAYVPAGEDDIDALVDHGVEDAREFLSENRRRGWREGWEFEASPSRSGRRSGQLGMHNPISKINL